MAQFLRIHLLCNERLFGHCIPRFPRPWRMRAEKTVYPQAAQDIGGDFRHSEKALREQRERALHQAEKRARE